MLWGKKTPAILPVKTAIAAAPLANPMLDEPMSDTMRREPGPVGSHTAQTVFGRSVVLRGELSGGEDLLIEGQLDGTVSLENHCLTVGQNGRVTAEIHARQVVILGAVKGNITASDKIEIRKSGHVVGDLVAAGIAIEEGAYFKGSIDVLRDEAAKDARPGPAGGLKSEPS